MIHRVQFFGERWDAPVVDDAVQVETPVGKTCHMCSEQVDEGDRGLINTVFRLDDDGKPYGSAEPVHAECVLRGFMGHEVGICHCTGYDSSRSAAKLVWAAVSEKRG